MKRNSLMKGFTYNTPTKESTFVNVNSYNNNNVDHDDYYYMDNGIPWPPRSYTCSFCRKEFKSAQALGGHMNVHRRDRARLRQSPPPTHDNHQGQGHNMLNLNLDPIITTNYTNNSTSSLLLPSSFSSSSSEPLKPVTCTLPLFVSPNSTSPSFSSPCAAHSSELKSLVVVDGVLLNPLSTTESTKSKIDESLSGNVGEYDHAFAREGQGCKMLKKGEILRVDLEIGLPRDYDLDLELRLGTTYS